MGPSISAISTSSPGLTAWPSSLTRPTRISGRTPTSRRTGCSAIPTGGKPRSALQLLQGLRAHRLPGGLGDRRPRAHRSGREAHRLHGDLRAADRPGGGAVRARPSHGVETRQGAADAGAARSAGRGFPNAGARLPADQRRGVFRLCPASFRRGAEPKAWRGGLPASTICWSCREACSDPIRSTISGWLSPMSMPRPCRKWRSGSWKARPPAAGPDGAMLLRRQVRRLYVAP